MGQLLEDSAVFVFVVVEVAFELFEDSLQLDAYIPFDVGVVGVELLLEGVLELAEYADLMLVSLHISICVV